MDKELEKYYESRFDMMATQGWKDLVEDAKKMLETYEDIRPLQTVEDLHFAKGQLDILNWLINLKKVSEDAFEELSDAKNI